MQLERDKNLYVCIDPFKARPDMDNAPDVHSAELDWSACSNTGRQRELYDELVTGGERGELRRFLPRESEAGSEGGDGNGNADASGDDVCGREGSMAGQGWEILWEEGGKRRRMPGSLIPIQAGLRRGRAQRWRV
jgi:hypothetical protein